MGDGGKQECQPKRPASILVDCDQCLATKPQKKKQFTQRHVQTHILHNCIAPPPLIFCRVLALTIHAEVGKLTMFLHLELPLNTWAFLHWSFSHKTRPHGPLHENWQKTSPLKGRSAEGETMTPSLSSNRHSGGTAFHLQIFHCLIRWRRKFYLSWELKLQMHTGSTHFSNVGKRKTIAFNKWARESRAWRLAPCWKHPALLL